MKVTETMNTRALFVVVDTLILFSDDRFYFYVEIMVTASLLPTPLEVAYLH